MGLRAEHGVPDPERRPERDERERSDHRGAHARPPATRSARACARRRGGRRPTASAGTRRRSMKRRASRRAPGRRERRRPEQDRRERPRSWRRRGARRRPGARSSAPRRRRAAASRRRTPRRRAPDATTSPRRSRSRPFFSARAARRLRRGRPDRLAVVHPSVGEEPRVIARAEHHEQGAEVRERESGRDRLPERARTPRCPALRAHELGEVKRSAVDRRCPRPTRRARDPAAPTSSAARADAFTPPAEATREARNRAIAATRSTAPSRSAPTTCGPSANVPTSTDASAEPMARGPRPNSATAMRLRCPAARRRRATRSSSAEAMAGAGRIRSTSSGEREPDHEERRAVLGRNALAGVADHRDRLRLLGAGVAVAQRDLRAPRRCGRDVGDLADVDAVDGADEVAGLESRAIAGQARARASRWEGHAAWRRPASRRGTRGRARLRRVRDSTTLARTDDGVMSSVIPCITPTSGGAPGALDANATSTSPVIVVCAALSPCPQKRSSSGSLTTTSMRSAAGDDALGLDARAVHGLPARAEQRSAERHARGAPLREAGAAELHPVADLDLARARPRSPRRAEGPRPSRRPRGRASQDARRRRRRAERSTRQSIIEEVP